MAGILCAAILSDTLKFQSPTATDYDRSTAERLADIAGIDIDEFSEMMFKAGTSLLGKSAEEAFLQDFKMISVQGYTIGISQITVMGMAGISCLKESIYAYMERLADSEGYDLLAVMFIDLLAGSTTLHFSGGLAEEAGAELDGTGQNRDFTYGSIMSRKKDVIPLITNIIEKKKT